MNLTDEQTKALYGVVTDIRNGEDEISLGGYAGTGKTSLIKYLIKFFPEFCVCAYTGKAANVLRKKNISATTIHSRIYKPFFDNGVMYFDLTDDPGCDGFIVDEASMVSEEIYQDLKQFGLPMIFVGDHGQLEPIESKLNLMEKPDYVLEQIHRNAGDIPRFADHLRKGFSSRGFKGQDGTVEFVKERNITDETLMSVDQIICAFNKTRVEINKRIREILGFEDLINVGERVMCLKNSRRQGLFNGMQGTVVNLYEYKRGQYMDFEFDGQIIEGIKYDQSQFGQEKYKIKFGQNDPIPFDYCSAITAHKSQGDEFDSVLVYEQKCNKWEHKRWAYTAASRARTNLKWKIAT